MITVRVPATSANLGPGFDAFGMAFKLYNTFSFKEKNDGKLTIRGVARRYQGRSNMVYRAMERVFDRVGYSPRGLYIHSDIQVPFSRGLGSSATCIVAGILGANALCGSPLDEQTLFDMAVEMEGHPDNIAPALFGGLVVSMMADGSNPYIKNTVAEDCFAFHAIIPDFTLSTVKARKVLPRKIDHKDGVFNISRATLTHLALTEGRPDILTNSMEDRLHQPYRKSLIHHFDAVCQKAWDSGALGTCISGAGPSIVAITPEAESFWFHDTMACYLEENHPGWQLLTLPPDDIGAVVTESEK
ncbi:homoserine kinase [Eubacterium aggregans]|uniref:homoserine kinase n=1 Tax=Eubacterium aggregans TaxID=81409 RepID=UPI003F2EF232